MSEQLRMFTGLAATKPAARTTDPKTSKDAAKKFTLQRSTQRFRLLQEFVRDAYAGGLGISDEGAAIRAQLSRLDSGHKRGAELRAAGLIEPVGVTKGAHGCDVRICTATQEGCLRYEQAKEDIK